MYDVQNTLPPYALTLLSSLFSVFLSLFLTQRNECPNVGNDLEFVIIYLGLQIF